MLTWTQESKLTAVNPEKGPPHPHRERKLVALRRYLAFGRSCRYWQGEALGYAGRAGGAPTVSVHPVAVGLSAAFSLFCISQVFRRGDYSMVSWED